MFAYAKILSGYGMWLVLRVKRGRQMSERSHSTALHAYPLLLGRGRLCPRGTVWYDGMVCSWYRVIL